MFLNQESKMFFNQGSKIKKAPQSRSQKVSQSKILTGSSIKEPLQTIASQTRSFYTFINLFFSIERELYYCHHKISSYLANDQLNTLYLIKLKTLK